MIVPLAAEPNQELAVTLANQAVFLHVFQKLSGLYVDVYVNDSLIIGGVLCQNMNRIVRSEYLGFVGDLMFFDNQSNGDPDHTGLGRRYSLIYLEAVEVA